MKGIGSLTRYSLSRSSPTLPPASILLHLKPRSSNRTPMAAQGPSAAPRPLRALEGDHRISSSNPRGSRRGGPTTQRGRRQARGGSSAGAPPRDIGGGRPPDRAPSASLTLTGAAAAPVLGEDDPSKKPRPDAQDNAQDGADDETEVCFICASAVVHQALTPCNHRTCHICALRLRALYKTRACAHCRVGCSHEFC